MDETHLFRSIFSKRTTKTQTAEIKPDAMNTKSKSYEPQYAARNGATIKTVMIVGQASCLSPFSLPFKSETGETPVLRCSDVIVVTTAIRASTGTRFKAMLQPTHPALLAVDESGGRLMMGSTRALACGSRRLVANIGEIHSTRDACAPL